MSTDGIAPGAVVLASVRSKHVTWDGELCDVLDIQTEHRVLFAFCASVWEPSRVAWVPINERAIDVVTLPVSAIAGGELR